MFVDQLVFWGWGLHADVDFGSAARSGLSFCVRNVSERRVGGGSAIEK
ncbi:MAG: hypothetical protein ACKESB_01685 [Candidatus Hodgkinia cicadicola]